MIRYNQVAKFYIKKRYIILNNFCLKQKIKINFSQNIYDFLVFAEENIFISQKIIDKYKISKAIIKFLTKKNFFVPTTTNNNIESICFDKLCYNPSTTSVNIDNNTLFHIYNKLNNELKKNLGKNFKKWKREIKNITFSINESNYNQVKSTRLTQDNNKLNLEKTLSIIKFIFSIREYKNIRGTNVPFFNFGSGGGFNSIFPILITKEDQTIIYDKYKSIFYYKKTPGIYKSYIKNCLIQADKKILDFSSYDYFLILFSHYKKVQEKYGNKSYKLLLLEGGQISFMFRQLYGNQNMPYLEIQGYYDQAIYDLIDKYDIVNIKNNLLLHTMCLSD